MSFGNLQEIYLKKGITEFKDIQQITQRLGTMSYAEASVEDTGTRLIFKVSFFSSLNAELLWSKTYQMRLVNFGDLTFTAALEVKQCQGGGEEADKKAEQLLAVLKQAQSHDKHCGKYAGKEGKLQLLRVGVAGAGRESVESRRNPGWNPGIEIPGFC